MVFSSLHHALLNCEEFQQTGRHAVARRRASVRAQPRAAGQQPWLPSHSQFAAAIAASVPAGPALRQPGAKIAWNKKWGSSVGRVNIDPPPKAIFFLAESGYDRAQTKQQSFSCIDYDTKVSEI